MSTQSIMAVCQWCETNLTQDHKGACPNCGKEGRRISAYFSDTVDVSDRLGWERRRTYFEHHKPAFIINLIIAIGSPFLGLWLAGWSGVIVGILMGIMSYWLGPKATSKIIEIMKGSNGRS